MQTVDVAYAEEWKFDHGIMVPLHFLTPRYDLPSCPANINCQGPPLTPLKRAWAFGEALRAAADAVPERIALVGTGGISHWPATPDSGKINEAWDREFLDALGAQRPRRAARLHRRGDLQRSRPGRLRDPHLHRRRGGGQGRQGHDRLLRADPDLRRRLHHGADGSRQRNSFPPPSNGGGQGGGEPQSRSRPISDHDHGLVEIVFAACPSRPPPYDGEEGHAVLRNVTTSTSRYAGCAGFSGSTGVTPW